LKAEGILIGSRMDENLEIHVIIFTQRTDPAVRTKIRKYIQSAMQTKIDAEFK
jgi:DNA segregation ATPase FtsK/SpoIIIE-like protein